MWMRLEKEEGEGQTEGWGRASRGGEERLESRGGREEQRIYR